MNLLKVALYLTITITKANIVTSSLYLITHAIKSEHVMIQDNRKSIVYQFIPGQHKDFVYHIAERHFLDIDWTVSESILPGKMNTTLRCFHLQRYTNQS